VKRAELLTVDPNQSVAALDVVVEPITGHVERLALETKRKLTALDGRRIPVDAIAAPNGSQPLGCQQISLWVSTPVSVSELRARLQEKHPASAGRVHDAQVEGLRPWAKREERLECLPHDAFRKRSRRVVGPFLPTLTGV
jgi:hypothetical protein